MNIRMAAVVVGAALVAAWVGWALAAPPRPADVPVSWDLEFSFDKLQAIRIKLPGDCPFNSAVKAVSSGSTEPGLIPSTWFSTWSEIARTASGPRLSGDANWAAERPPGASCASFAAGKERALGRQPHDWRTTMAGGSKTRWGTGRPSNKSSNISVARRARPATWRSMVVRLGAPLSTLAVSPFTKPL